MTKKKSKDTAKQADAAKQADTAKQTDTFVVELGLSVEDQVNRKLCKALDLQLHCYNGVMSFAHKSLKSMRSSKRWQAAYNLPKNNLDRLKELSKLHKKYHLTEFDLMKQATRVCNAMHRDDIGSHEAQCIGRDVWRAVEPFLFKQNGMPRFKSARRGINTISGTDNTDIRFDIVQLVPDAPQPQRKRLPEVEVRNGSKFFDLCGRPPCFDAHCYNAPYISILCGMLDMSRRKTSKPKQIEAFVKNGDLNNRILHRKFQFRAKPCLPCAA